jgi:hypothetical protein
MNELKYSFIRTQLLVFSELFGTIVHQSSEADLVIST